MHGAVSFHFSLPSKGVKSTAVEIQFITIFLTILFITNYRIITLRATNYDSSLNICLRHNLLTQ